jgi:glutathione S-transferase
VPLLLAPKLITTLLGTEGHHGTGTAACLDSFLALDNNTDVTDLEVYFARCLGLTLVLLAVMMMLLTGTIPLTSTAQEPVSAEDSDPRAPYAVPVLRLSMIYHGLAAIYCYTSYVWLGQSGFMLGVVGFGALAAMGLWCVLFATSRGHISRRTGADKRTSGFPFKNEKAYNKKVDKKRI